MRPVPPVVMHELGLAGEDLAQGQAELVAVGHDDRVADLESPAAQPFDDDRARRVVVDAGSGAGRGRDDDRAAARAGTVTHELTHASPPTGRPTSR